MVAKNLLGFFNILEICFAFFSPSFACFEIFASFKEINAISVIAKKAFKKISTNNTIICEIIYFYKLPFLCL